MGHLVLPLFYNEILYLNPFKRIEEVTPDIIIFIYTSHFFRQKEYIYVAYACDRTTTPAGMQMHHVWQSRPWNISAKSQS
jgi:hypothetical protein